MSDQPSAGFSLVGPRAVRTQVRQLAGTESPASWGGDLRLLVLWLVVWVLLLLGAILSPVVVMLQLIFQDRHWRLGLLFFVVVPAIALTVFVLALLSVPWTAK